LRKAMKGGKKRWFHSNDLPCSFTYEGAGGSLKKDIVPTGVRTINTVVSKGYIKSVLLCIRQSDEWISRRTAHLSR
jgi:hypothetical protein